MSIHDRGTPAEWLRFAHGDLVLADPLEQPGLIYELMCTHAQQAAEKAFKAVLIHRGVEPPFTHNVGLLLNLLEAVVTVPDSLAASAALTDYAVSSRYPDDLGEIGEAEWEEAVAIARAVVAWAEGVIGDRADAA